MRRLPEIPANDPDGLEFCAQALALFRGPLLALTPPAPWIDRLRGVYNELFQELVLDTLERMEALDDLRVMPLLTDRVLSVLPGDVRIRERLTAFFARNDMPDQLIGYLLFLAEKSLIDPESGEREDWPEPVRALAEDTVYARLFGRFEIENTHGKNMENLGKTSVAWLTLKYMLLRPERKVTVDELSRTVWCGGDAPLTNSNLLSRVKRMRDLLAPLALQKPDQFLLSEGTAFQFNPAYSVCTDGSLFLDLMKQRRDTSLHNPQGLELCIHGLRLFRAPILQYCPGAPWVDETRAAFLAEFHELALDTFDRMKALDDFSALGLLTNRVDLLMPEAEEFHEMLLDLMIETERFDELRDHIAELARVEDRASAYICAPSAARQGLGYHGEHELRESKVILEHTGTPAWLGRYRQAFSDWLTGAVLPAEHCKVW